MAWHAATGEARGIHPHGGLSMGGDEKSRALPGSRCDAESMNAPTTPGSQTALIVIDVQKGFEDAQWGQRNNSTADENIELLTGRWAETGQPIVVVRHNSASPTSPLHPDNSGNAFKDYIEAVEPALLVTKSVNSAFFGEPSLDDWLAASDIARVAIVGIQTNMCCETTARMAGNLGYEVLFVADATHTFDLAGPDGAVLTADQLTTATVTNLHGGGFATVVTTAELLG